MGIGKLQKRIFDTINTLNSRSVAERARRLPLDDPRRPGTLEASTDKVATVLLSSMPNPSCRFSNEQWFSAVQNYFGSVQSSCAHLSGTKIINHPNCRQMEVDPHGRNLKCVTGVRGDGVRHFHDRVVDKSSEFLRRCRCPHIGGRSSDKQTATGMFNTELAAISNNRSDEATSLRQGIIPDIIIPSSSNSSLVVDQGDSLYDVKTLSNSQSSYHTLHPENATEVKANAVRTSYLRSARQLDSLIGHDGAGPGPVEKKLSKAYTGNVIGLVVGSFGGVNKEFHQLIHQVAQRLTSEHCRSWDVPPSAALGLIKRQLQQELGLIIHRGWAQLMLDRLANCTERPAGSATTNRDYDVDELRNHHLQFPDTYITHA